eukprot:GHVH01004391.1.p1 GENE.GHVH01004391.1~~GHVH01004391.1.p1  ORF type:complete len:441 (-),score=53.65 GHVH01004391.1:510-1832(-)
MFHDDAAESVAMIVRIYCPSKISNTLREVVQSILDFEDTLDSITVNSAVKFEPEPAWLLLESRHPRMEEVEGVDFIDMIVDDQYVRRCMSENEPVTQMPFLTRFCQATQTVMLNNSLYFPSSAEFKLQEFTGLRSKDGNDKSLEMCLHPRSYSLTTSTRIRHTVEIVPLEPDRILPATEDKEPPNFHKRHEQVASHQAEDSDKEFYAESHFVSDEGDAVWQAQNSGGQLRLKSGLMLSIAEPPYARERPCRDQTSLKAGMTNISDLARDKVSATEIFDRAGGFQLGSRCEMEVRMDSEILSLRDECTVIPGLYHQLIDGRHYFTVRAKKSIDGKEKQIRIACRNHGPRGALEIAKNYQARMSTQGIIFPSKREVTTDDANYVMSRIQSSIGEGKQMRFNNKRLRGYESDYSETEKDRDCLDETTDCGDEDEDEDVVIEHE